MELTTPRPDDLPEVLDVLASWALPGLPVQLHVGDLGWAWRLGPERLASDLRVWRDDRGIVAIAAVDPGLARLAVSPDVADDEGVASALVDGLERPTAGVLSGPAGAAEARFGPALRAALTRRGWAPDESWTSLSLDLTGDLPASGIEVVDGAEHVDERVAVQRAAFTTSTFTAQRWHVMAEGPAYRRARCVVGRVEGVPVAAATVWAAGPGRAGLIEPLGTHHDHRGHGYGRALTITCAHALRDLGAATMTVATPTANAGAIATYASAGMTQHAPTADFRRPPAPKAER